MANVPTSRAPDDDLGREIERLLRHLPMAEPLRAPEPRPIAAQPSPPRGVGRSETVTPKATTARTLPRPEMVGVWMRVLLTAALGVAVLQWPYMHECGWMLYQYLGVVAALLIAGGWASIIAWRMRIAPAHVLSLVVAFWGIVLAAEQILPRIGYAAYAEEWSCRR